MRPSAFAEGLGTAAASPLVEGCAGAPDPGAFDRRDADDVSLIAPSASLLHVPLPHVLGRRRGEGVHGLGWRIAGNRQGNAAERQRSALPDRPAGIAGNCRAWGADISGNYPGADSGAARLPLPKFTDIAGITRGASPELPIGRSGGESSATPHRLPSARPLAGRSGSPVYAHIIPHKHPDIHTDFPGTELSGPGKCEQFGTCGHPPAGCTERPGRRGLPLRKR